MIGLVDETMLFALKRAWRIVAADVDEWRKLFPPEVEASRVNGWHKALTAPDRYTGPADKVVAFGLAELQRPAMEHPGIFTRLSNARATTDPVGMGGAGDDESEGYLGLESSVEVVVVAPSKQLGAALATFCLSAIFSQLKPILLRSQVRGLAMKEVSEIGPMRDLLPERGGAYWYRLRYSTFAECKLVDFESELLRLPFSINDESAIDETGNPGRVTQMAREVG